MYTHTAAPQITPSVTTVVTRQHGRKKSPLMINTSPSCRVNVDQGLSGDADGQNLDNQSRQWSSLRVLMELYVFVRFRLFGNSTCRG